MSFECVNIDCYIRFYCDFDMSMIKVLSFEFWDEASSGSFVVNVYLLTHNNDTITNTRSVLFFDESIEWLCSLLFAWSSNLNYHYFPLSSSHNHFLCHCQWSLWKSNERLQIYIFFYYLLWCQQHFNLESKVNACTLHTIHSGFGKFHSFFSLQIWQLMNSHQRVFLHFYFFLMNHKLLSLPCFGCRLLSIA